MGWLVCANARILEAEDHDDVVIKKILTEYREGVVEFHAWFHSAIRQRNAAALKEFERQKKELAEYAKGMFGRPIDDPSSRA